MEGQRFLRRERLFRDRYDPFDFYDDSEFKKRFRFTKVTTRYIITLIEMDERITRHTRRNAALPPYQQVLLCLRFYATGSFQITVGDFLNIHQSTVSKIIKHVSIAIAIRRNRFIFMPRNRNEILETQTDFRNIAQFPRVIGAIDCTHIEIANPGGEDSVRYINRKGHHSINTQVVCNARMLITNIVARWPGSVHDSRIFNECALKERLEEGAFPGYILGDPGYACLRYLMTPVQNPRTDAEINYNRAQRKTRNIIERMFGTWKRRFPCLKYILRVNMERTYAIIIATAVLQNIAILQGDPPFEEEDIPPEEEPEAQQLDAPRGVAVRARLIAEHFT